jgi:hypothetical protein
MRNRLYAVVLLVLVLVACKKDEELPTQVVNNMATNVSDTIGQGTFTSYEHGLGGRAILYNETTGARTLRLENFNMTPGPDVYLFLSTTSSYSAANVIEIQKLTTGYSNSNINFPVNSTNYTPAHKYVLVYCIQFSSLFGYAELK